MEFCSNPGLTKQCHSMSVDPFKILKTQYDPLSVTYDILLTHSVLVTNKAREIATAYLDRHPEADIDIDFITEAGLLHDIGIGQCDAPKIHCFGTEPYVRHGVIGRETLEGLGLCRHALVCERHTGAGITREEALQASLPLPDRDYLPQSLEEKIICVADKFYSKTPAKLWRPKALSTIRKGLARWGAPVLTRWDRLYEEVTE